MSETDRARLRPDAQRDTHRQGLKLTPAQAARFWSLGVAESERLLESLAAQGAVTRTADGHYVLFAPSVPV
jgi:hypothetical protein